MEVVKGKFPDKIDKMDTENLPWYKLKISDFEGACYRGLKKSERLLLRELIDLYWKESGLSSDPKELSELLYEDYTPEEIRAFLQGKASRWIIVKGKELYCSRLENRYWHIVKTREAKETKSKRKAKKPEGKPRKEREFLIDYVEAEDIVFALQTGFDTDMGKGKKLLRKAFPELEEREILQIVEIVEGGTYEGDYRNYLHKLCMEVTRKDSEGEENKAG